MYISQCENVNEKKIFWLEQIRKNNKPREEGGILNKERGEGAKKIKKLISGGTSIRTLRV